MSRITSHVNIHDEHFDFLLFPLKLQEAEKLWNDGNLSDHSKLCLQLKMTEQRILNNAVAFCQSQKERAEELDDNATSYLGDDLDGAVDVEELDICGHSARLFKPRGPVALAMEEDTKLDDDEDDDIPTTSSTSLSTTTKDTESIPEISDESQTDSKNDLEGSEQQQLENSSDDMPNGKHEVVVENGDDVIKENGISDDNELDERDITEASSKLDNLHLGTEKTVTKTTKTSESTNSQQDSIGTNGVTINGAQDIDE